MTPIKILAAMLAAAALLPAAARADDSPGTESVTHGALTATLSWRDGDFGVADGRLTITRNGAVAFDQAIPDVLCDGCVLPGGGSDDVQIADLDGDGEDEVIVTAFTGGENCCVEMGIYDYHDVSRGYGELVENWLSGGYELRDLDGDDVPEIVASDIRFEERFTGHGTPFPPPAVFRYEHQDESGVLVDDTEAFPSVVRRNASEAQRHIRSLRRHDPDAGAYVSAYVADQYLLANGATGVHTLDRLVARKVVTHAYRTRLLTLLHRYGYR